MRLLSRTVLDLLRLPNLFTVPGDVLVGWCLGGLRGGFPFFGILASLCLYAAGLLLNDFCDVAVDARERPGRPIPSGRISRPTVGRAVLVLSLLGLLFSGRGLPMAAALLALIVFYDAYAKRVRGLGVTVMGLCRGANVLLGVAVSWPMGEMPWPPLAVTAAGFFAVYILLVSVVAKNEVEPHAVEGPLLRRSPLMLTALLFPVFWVSGAEPLWPVAVAALLLWPVLNARESIPAFVAGLIRCLIPLQLLWCLVALPRNAFLVPMVLIACWVAARVAGRRFAGS